MPESAWAALAAISAAALTAFIAPVFRRKHDAAETAEIVDRMAREWIARLEAEVADLRQQMENKDAAHRAEVSTWVQHVGVLENHINARKQPPPPPRPILGH